MFFVSVPLNDMNYFCCRSSRIYEQSLLGIIVRRFSFYSEIYKHNIFEEIHFKVGSSESINKILEKYLLRNFYFRKLFCIYEQNP